MVTERYGLLGWPVKHSVSPQMQGAGFRAIGRAASYELIPVAPEDLVAKVAELKALGFRGWNCTIPHKGGILACLDQIDPAAAGGSVNTVIHLDGKLYGHSTDGYGLERSLAESFGVSVRGGNLLFWGTGGAARAVGVYFASQGLKRLTLVNRTLARAEELAGLIRQVSPDCTVSVLAPDDLPALRSALHDTQALVQCTSVGLHPDDPCSVPEDLLTPGLNVLDMIYRPTKLLAEAPKRGCQVADGRAMLLYQGVRAFELWTGVSAPVAAMRAGLDAALAGKS